MEGESPEMHKKMCTCTLLCAFVDASSHILVTGQIKNSPAISFDSDFNLRFFRQVLQNGLTRLGFKAIMKILKPENSRRGR